MSSENLQICNALEAVPVDEVAATLEDLEKIERHAWYRRRITRVAFLEADLEWRRAYQTMKNFTGGGQ